MGKKIKRVMRNLLVIAGVVASLYVVICGALYVAMRQSPDTFARIMRHVPWPAFVVLPFKPMWMHARSGHVSLGEVAPDFSLETADHKSRVQLSSLRGQQPVVLVFGSYT